MKEFSKVFILDNIKSIRSRLQILLNSKDLKVIESSNSIEFFNVFLENRCNGNLIIMDIELMAEDGFQVIRKIRNKNKTEISSHLTYLCAQGHYFTTTTQLIMSPLYSKMFPSNKNGLKFVAACVSEENHDVGIRMVADILELDGWSTYYLGANVPKKDLMSFLIDVKPEVLGLSITMTFNLHKAIELIHEARNIETLKGIKILVGGYPFNVDKNLWRQVGADFYAPNAIRNL